MRDVAWDLNYFLLIASLIALTVWSCAAAANDASVLADVVAEHRGVSTAEACLASPTQPVIASTGDPALVDESTPTPVASVGMDSEGACMVGKPLSSKEDNGAPTHSIRPDKEVVQNLALELRLKSKLKSEITTIRRTLPAPSAWWPEPVPNQLNLLFAGEAAFGQAIALLFDAPFDQDESANRFLAVLDSRGNPVKGKWVVAIANPRMLVMKVAHGRYRLEIKTGLIAKDGLAISEQSGGVVYVH